MTDNILTRKQGKNSCSESYFHKAQRVRLNTRFVSHLLEASC